MMDGQSKHILSMGMHTHPTAQLGSQIIEQYSPPNQRNSFLYFSPLMTDPRGQG